MIKKIQNTMILLVAIAMNKIYNDFKIVSHGLNGNKCYLDFKINETISNHDFTKIEKTIKKLIGSGLKFNIKKLNNKFIANANDIEILFNDEIEDSSSKIKFFKLLQIGGLGNEKTRIHFCAFENKSEFEKYLEHLKEMNEIDHRKIGKELGIFCFSDKVGQGLPIFLPNGAFIKDKISEYLKSICLKYDFELVSSPILGSKELYITSGHWDLYKTNNFPPIKVDNEIYMLRPMTCPHHMMIYKNEKKSYRDLPLALCEDSILHRYESSGGLIGLERVRSMELFDTHIFVTKNQVSEVIIKVYEMIKIVYKKLEIKIDKIDLSLRSNEKEKFFNDDEMWKKEENELESTLNLMKVKYTKVLGEAAFYGPKIDFQYKTTNDKYITISTIQLDFLLPKKFELEYINVHGNFERPIIIHLGLIGTYERFISCLLSQTKGILPLWLTKKQVVIIPVNNNFHLEYAKKILEELKINSIRASIDDSEERMAKKIREAQISKIPFQIIIGDEEVETQNFSYRKYGEKNTNKIFIKDFIKLFNYE